MPTTSPPRSPIWPAPAASDPGRSSSQTLITASTTRRIVERVHEQRVSLWRSVRECSGSDGYVEHRGGQVTEKPDAGQTTLCPRRISEVVGVILGPVTERIGRRANLD